MCNITGLGASASAFGVVGDDPQADELCSLLEQSSIDARNVAVEKGRATTVKKRVIASSQQLVRIDYEDTHDVSADVRRKITDALIGEIKSGSFDAVIFEDYAKGMLGLEMASEIAEAAADAGVVTALDPHPGHPLNISGITLMTPNKSEAFGLAGILHPDMENEDEEIQKAAEIICEKWNPEYLLITLGPKGMALFVRGQSQVVIPTRAREVFDVSGAGDTVIAAFTLALLSGADPLEAAEIANHAAGIVVGKVGTVPVSADELLESFTDN
jgi:D-beta-D-heptose 7-phosphate kinase/D-beta-D-heptose 1-phosphate adenosyltransferase